MIITTGTILSRKRIVIRKFYFELLCKLSRLIENIQISIIPVNKDIDYERIKFYLKIMLVSVTIYTILT